MARVRYVEWPKASQLRERVIPDLLTRSGKGEVAAFLHLVDIFYPAVQATVAGAERTEPGDDAVVAAFVKLWRSAAGFDGSDPRVAVRWIMDSVAAQQPSPV